MNNNKVLQSLHNSWLSLISLIKTMYKKMPFLMIVFTYLMYKLIEKFGSYSNSQMWILTSVILLSSIAIYLKSQNYGEAVLSLSAGLFTIYTVTWSKSIFVSFICIWIAFTLIVLLSSSIRISSKIETIYMEAAFALGTTSNNDKKCVKELQKISDDLKDSVLGPIEKAEIIRQFCFRKMQLDIMPIGLKWVNIFWSLTRIDYLTLSDFVCIVLKNASILSSSTTVDNLFEFIYDGMKKSTATPSEYIDMFKKTRYLLIKNKNAVLYFKALTDYFEAGLCEEEGLKFIYDQMNLE
ncbi:hypothetical protein [Hydrogenoanaerobacterium sp.]|uniref:hypothetical protein n=1 Tax=Hydrogenoanaerobacterium sp. TaxID=2953763 RepID=UPI0028965E54|nr:hypothetical protein [Hydrogenoanaerobacterium sp.]